MRLENELDEISEEQKLLQHCKWGRLCDTLLGGGAAADIQVGTLAVETRIFSRGKSHQPPPSLRRRARSWAGKGRETPVIYGSVQASLPLSSARSFAQVEPP
ncbi:hypothetical protein AOLI_G00266390 [Acnodon oligacanthus]